MALFTTQADTRGPSLLAIGARALGVASAAAALGLMLSVGAAQAADSADRIVPPTAAEVAMLRQLLALQHPTLLGTAAPAKAAQGATPTVTTEPGHQLGQTTSDVENGGVAPQAAAPTARKLNIAFRESLERSMAAAGYAGGQF